MFDADKHNTHGKLFTLTHDKDGSGRVDTDDIEFSGYLEGDGDFRSEEVKRLRDEADVIITNPPFSLFREFLAWIMEAGKQFVIVGNKNAITYKEVFPACWYTNIDHGKRHEPLLLDTMAHNLKFNKKLKKKLQNNYSKLEYPHYDNYDAIEVPFTECIPSDYDGVMGVPITFMDKYNPEQFEIIGGTANGQVPDEMKIGNYSVHNNPFIGDKKIYQRILVRPKKGGNQ